MLKVLDLSRNMISYIPSAFKIKDEEDELVDMTFKKFYQLRLIDLSSNNLDEFPVCLKECGRLKIIRLIKNNIKSVPSEFVKSENMKKTLEELILNSNPIKELDSNISHWDKLKVLGISYTEVTEIPQSIAIMKSLEQLNCFNAKLTEPK